MLRYKTKIMFIWGRLWHIHIKNFLFCKFCNKYRIHAELKLPQCFTNQTPFTVHFSSFLCGSLQLKRWPPCLTPPDNEPSITTGCGNRPQGRALTDSQDVCCMAAAGLPRHVSLYTHILQKRTSSELNTAACGFSLQNCENIDSFQ